MSGTSIVGLDRHLAAHGQLTERGGEAAVDQQRRGDAARERAQLVDGLAGLEQRRVDGLGGAVGVVGQLSASPAEVHGEPDQPLLRPVVDVALEPAQRDGLGRASGVAAALDPAYLLLELGAAAQQHVRQAAVQGRGEPHHQGQGEQRDRTDRPG